MQGRSLLIRMLKKTLMIPILIAILLTKDPADIGSKPNLSYSASECQIECCRQAIVGPKDNVTRLFAPAFDFNDVDSVKASSIAIKDGLIFLNEQHLHVPLTPDPRNGVFSGPKLG